MPFANLKLKQEYHREWYQKNKRRRLDANKRWEERKVFEFKKFKTGISCFKCGEDDPVCLEFHHLDPTKKDINISNAVRKWSTKRLNEEIGKCIVLCSNCHKKEHAKLKSENGTA